MFLRLPPNLYSPYTSSHPLSEFYVITSLDIGPSPYLLIIFHRDNLFFFLLPFRLADLFLLIPFVPLSGQLSRPIYDLFLVTVELSS